VEQEQRAASWVDVVLSCEKTIGYHKPELARAEPCWFEFAVLIPCWLANL
jgi:hypothetical protein